jgi:hypothetical protein
MRKLDRTVEFIQKHGPTAFWLWVGYTFIWAPVFGVAWLLQKFNPEPIPHAIFNFCYYAGYPVYALFLTLMGALTLFASAIVWVFTWTMPYGLYALPFVALGFLYYRFWHAHIRVKRTGRFVTETYHPLLNQAPIKRTIYVPGEDE